MKCLRWVGCAMSAVAVSSVLAISSALTMSSALAAEAFVGRWAVKPEVCSARGETPQTAALVATDNSLWWFDGYCSIGKMYKAKAVYVLAHCGSKRDVSVTLDAQGDRMKVTWNRAKTEEMRRCP
jgi:hypothetical protein